MTMSLSTFGCWSYRTAESTNENLRIIPLWTKIWFSKNVSKNHAKAANNRAKPSHKTCWTLQRVIPTSWTLWSLVTSHRFIDTTQKAQCSHHNRDMKVKLTPIGWCITSIHYRTKVLQMKYYLTSWFCME